MLLNASTNSSLVTTNSQIFFSFSSLPSVITSNEINSPPSNFVDSSENLNHLSETLVLCQYLVQVKMRNFSHFNPPEAQPQCVFFYTIVRIHLVTYSYNGYEFVSYCRKLPDIQKSTGMLDYNLGF